MKIFDTPSPGRRAAAIVEQPRGRRPTGTAVITAAIRGLIRARVVSDVLQISLMLHG